MSGRNESNGMNNMMEAYYNLLGEAHLENIANELTMESNKIDELRIPDSLDEWFDNFQKKRNISAQRKKLMRRVKQISSKVAVFVLIFIASLTAVTMSVEAFRIRVFNFFLERNESYTEIRIEEDISNQTDPGINVENYYYLTYLPYGYHFEKHLVSGESLIIYYTDGNNSIIFNQVTISADYQFDTEGADVERVAIGDYGGTLVIKGDRVILFWNENGNSYFIKGQVAANETIKMAESLEKNK